MVWETRVQSKVTSKTQKMVLDPSLLNSQHYKKQIKDQWSNPGKGVAPSPMLSVVATKKEPLCHP